MIKIHKNLHSHPATVSHAERESRSGHKSAILWFTGLSGAGKSSLAHAVERKLFDLNCATYVFDGDNVRQGLCADLAFSPQDRMENIRRVGEMAKLFTEAGVIALTAFISPFISDRERVRNLVPAGRFIEIYCCCSLEICEKRDVKGLYAKAREGNISEFTGISSPYEPPHHPELLIDTGKLSLSICVDEVVNYLKFKKIIY